MRPSVLSRERDGVLGVRNDDLFIEQLEDPFRRSHRALEEVVFLGEVLDGAKETLCVLKEGGHDSDGNHSVHALGSAVPNDQREGERSEELNDRKEERVVRDGAEVSLQVVPVHLVVFCCVGLLAVE